MNPRSAMFLPLAPGESPGDPELGGWRPLTVKSLRHALGYTIKENLTTPSLEPISTETSLIVLTQILGYQFTSLRMWQAVRTVGNELIRRSN